MVLAGQARNQFYWVALALAILLPLVAWLSLLIGLRLRTQGRAIMGAKIGRASCRERV